MYFYINQTVTLECHQNQSIKIHKERAKYFSKTLTSYTFDKVSLLHKRAWVFTHTSTHTYTASCQKSDLPHNVDVVQPISEMTLKETSFSC